METRFYFHKLHLDGITNTSLASLFDTIIAETEHETNPPYYIESTASRQHVQVLKKEIIGNKTIFFGKLVQSQRSIDFKEENNGEFIDIDIDENLGICQLERGVIYFLLAIIDTDERIMVVEDVPFALNIGGLVTYLKQRLNISDEAIYTKQKLGRDIISVINAVGNSEITLAKIRFKKNISLEDIRKIDVVEEAIEKLKEQGLDCELRIHWQKGKRDKLVDFIKRLLRIDSISELNNVDFGSLLRTFYFEIDNTALPRLNMKDDIIKFIPPNTKDYFTNHEEELFTYLKPDFIQKYDNGKLTE